MAKETNFLDYAGLSIVWDKVKEKDSEITQVFGYYFNNDFYKDSSYITKLLKSTKHIYIDQNSKEHPEDIATGIYYYDGEKYCRAIQDATGNVPGILKLYSDPGQNTDGTMTQKAITNGVNNIKLTAEGEVLLLGQPWD